MQVLTSYFAHNAQGLHLSTEHIQAFETKTMSTTSYFHSTFIQIAMVFETAFAAFHLVVPQRELPSLT